jgi:M6 family metalloprotease-like protein
MNSLDRADVPSFYRDFLNKAQDLNHHHTLHEYWMEDSAGRFGVDLTAFGPYRLPKMSYQYGVDEDPEYSFNPGAWYVYFDLPSSICSIDSLHETLPVMTYLLTVCP